MMRTAKQIDDGKGEGEEERGVCGENNAATESRKLT